MIDPDWLAPIAIGATVFIIIYLAVTFVTSPRSPQAWPREDVNVVDRTLGFAFGVVARTGAAGPQRDFHRRGLSAANGRPPTWVTEARIYPLVNATARALQTLAPETSRIAETAASAGCATRPDCRNNKK